MSLHCARGQIGITMLEFAIQRQALFLAVGSQERGYCEALREAGVSSYSLPSKGEEKNLGEACQLSVLSFPRLSCTIPQTYWKAGMSDCREWGQFTLVGNLYAPDLSQHFDGPLVCIHPLVLPGIPPFLYISPHLDLPQSWVLTLFLLSPTPSFASSP